MQICKCGLLYSANTPNSQQIYTDGTDTDAANLSDAEMGTSSSYVGWDFGATWNAPSGSAYPTLK